MNSNANRKLARARSSAVRRLSMAIAVVVAGLAFVACGQQGGGGGGQAEQGGGQNPPIERDPANAQKSLKVGSKNFTEQLILGEIYGQALEAAGFKVDKQLNLGSEQIAFKAVKDGQVDMYPEYVGTALTNFFRVKVPEVPKDPHHAFEQMKRDAARAGLAALPPTPFNDTYEVGLATDDAQRLGVRKVSDLQAKAKDLTISGFPECRQRPDCLVGLRNVYGLRFKKFLASEEPYQVLDTNQADVAFLFSTQGQLTLPKYTVLQDDKRLFPPYQASLLVRNQTMPVLGPKGVEILERVQKPLNLEQMRELNSRVELDKQQPAKVAADYLKASGFVK